VGRFCEPSDVGALVAFRAPTPRNTSPVRPYCQRGGNPPLTRTPRTRAPQGHSLRAPAAHYDDAGLLDTGRLQASRRTPVCSEAPVGTPSASVSPLVAI